MAAHELRIEIEVAVKKSPKLQITERFLRESVAYWVENGIPFPGVKVTAVLWTRDGGAQKAARSESTIEEAREHMLRRFLHYLNWQITVTNLGRRQRAKPS